MPPGFYLLIAAQFVSVIADNALIIVAIALLQQQGQPGWRAPLFSPVRSRTSSQLAYPAYLGDWAYELTLKIDSRLNSFRARVGLPYWSLSRYLKLKVKRAVSYIGELENAFAREARSRGLQGVVCGHIHHAEMREIDGTLYCNDGDWVESLTALVEHPDGRLEIIDWAAHLRQLATLPPLAPTAAVAGLQPVVG